MPLRRLPTAPAPPAEPSLWDRIGGLPGAAAGVLRAGTGVASAEGGPLGALTSGAGEAGAEMLEGSAFKPSRLDPKSFLGGIQASLDPGENESPWLTGLKGFAQGALSPIARIGAAAGMGAVPFAKVMPVGQVGQSIVRGGAYSGVGEAGREFSQGQQLDPKAIGTSAVEGGLVGGALSKLLGGPTGGSTLNREEYMGRTRPWVSPQPEGWVPPPTATEAAAKTVADRTGKFSALQHKLAGKYQDEFEAAGSRKKIRGLDADVAAVKAEEIAAKKAADEEAALTEIEASKEGLVQSEPKISESVTAKEPGGRTSRKVTTFAPEKEKAGTWSEDVDDGGGGGPLGRMLRPPVPPTPPPVGHPARTIYDYHLAAGKPEEEAAALTIEQYKKQKGLPPATRFPGWGPPPTEPTGAVPTAPVTPPAPPAPAAIPLSSPLSESQAAAGAAARASREASHQARVDAWKATGLSEPAAQQKAALGAMPKGVEAAAAVTEPVAGATIAKPANYKYANLNDEDLAQMADYFDRTKNVKAFAEASEEVTRRAAAPAAEAAIPTAAASTQAQRDALMPPPATKAQIAGSTVGAVERVQPPANVTQMPGNAAAVDRAAAPIEKAASQAIDRNAFSELQGTLKPISQGAATQTPEIQAALAGAEAEAATEQADTAAKTARKGFSVVEPTAPVPPVAPTAAPTSTLEAKRQFAAENFSPEANAKLAELRTAYEAETDPITKRGLGAQLSAVDRAERTRLKAAAPDVAAPAPVAKPVEPTDPTLVGGSKEYVPSESTQTPGVHEMTDREINDQLRDIEKAKANPNFLERLKGMGGNEKGAVDPALMRALGLGLAGGAVGAATDPLNDRTQSAMAGAGAGISIAVMPQLLQQMGATPEGISSAIAKLRSPGGPTEAAKELFHTLPQIQRFNYLASTTRLPANAIAGPYGSAFFGALEHGLAGDPRGWAAMKELNPVSFMKDMYKGWEEAKTLIGRAEGQTMSQSTSFQQRLLSSPGTIMTAGDIASRNALERAGFTEDEARRITLTSEPATALGKNITRFGKSRTEGGKDSALAQIMLPFKRTGTNILEQGAERTPGLGFLAQRAKDTPDPMKNQLIQQGLGGLLGVGSYELGANLDPETAKVARKYVSNAGGQYSLPVSLGFAAGQAVHKGKPAISGAVTEMNNALPLPTIEPLTEWAKFLSGNGPAPQGAMPAFVKEDLLAPKTAAPKALARLRRR